MVYIDDIIASIFGGGMRCAMECLYIINNCKSIF